MNEQKKDYSLLRLFDLEAAKRGEPICDAYGNRFSFIAESGEDGEHAIRAVCGNMALCKGERMRMKPLAWVEGKPVYVEDDLYHIGMGQKVTVKAPIDGLHVFAEFEIDGCVATSISALTWNPPKVKREGWVNIYGRGSACWRYHTKEAADNSARLGSGIIDPARIACIRIEWEE